jgi:hypothetical protein
MRCERATPDEGRRPEGNDSPGRVIVQVKERVRTARSNREGWSWRQRVLSDHIVSADFGDLMAGQRDGRGDRIRTCDPLRPRPVTIAVEPCYRRLIASVRC